MSTELAHAVYLDAPDGSGQVCFAPGDTVPDWARKQIGPHAYEGYDPTGAGASADEENGPPPKSGRGSGKGAWSDYAESDEAAAVLAAADVQIPADATREDIIAALESAGVRTE